ncbi:MAG: allantoinase AllB [Actinomycetes bacterium]
MDYELIVRSLRVVTPQGEVAASVAVNSGKIVLVTDFNAQLDGKSDITIEGVLMPGLVDTHVHINEPGRTEWEGFETATKAAAAGGVTTVIDMPLNSIPPTTSVLALNTKKEAALGKTSVDVGFWGGSIPGNSRDLIPLLNAGVFGFKCFLLHSGVDEFPATSDLDFAQALEILAKVDGLMVIHAEDAHVIDESVRAGSRDYQEFLASRPKGAENTAIAQVIREARRTGARVHVLHLSSGDALEMIKEAKADGVRISVETCPHYLSLTAEEVADGATQFKCCPPIRERANQDELWEGLLSGVIDQVVSDHSPCTPDLKRFDEGDFQSAWGGISSLQLGLSILWSAGSARGATLTDIANWMSAAPARLVGLHQKGAIEVGKDADLLEFQPAKEFTVTPAELFHRNPVSPYAGKVLQGVVQQTWLRGTLIYQNGALTGAPRGQFLYREGNTQ